MKLKHCCILIFIFSKLFSISAQDHLEQIKTAYEKEDHILVNKIFNTFIDSVKQDEVKADFYYYLAQSQKSVWNYNDAIENFLKARDLYVSNNSEISRLFWINIHLATITKDQGNYAKAKEYFDVCQHLISQSFPPEKQALLAIYYNALGRLYLNTSDFDNAIKVFKKSIYLREEYRNGYHTYIPLIHLALVYSNIEIYDSAVYYNQLALESLKKYSKNNYNLHYGVIYNNIGDNMQKLNSPKSKNFFFKALNIYKSQLNNNVHPYVSTTYLNLGNYYYSENQYDSALLYYNFSVKSLIPRHESYKEGMLNSISPIDMLDALQKKSLTQLQIGKSQNNLTHYNNALQTIETAIKIIEKTRNSYRNRESQLIFTANQKEIFDLAIYLSSAAYQKTGEQKYLTKFYEFSEKAKANVLLLAIRNLEAKEFGGIPEKLIMKENNLVREIAYLEELLYEIGNSEEEQQEKQKHEIELAQLKHEYDSLITYFENNYPQYYQLKYNYDYVSLTAVQEKLHEHQALIHYYTTDSLLFRCVITNNNTKLEEIPINESYDKALKNYYSSMSDFDHTNHTLTDYKQYIQSAHLLNKKIIPSFDEEITEIIAIPDEYLAQVPFDAFLAQLPDTQSIDYKSLPYLLHQYTFSYNYSATLLYNKQYRPEPAKQKLLAFAPDYNNGIEVGEHNIRSIKYREDLYPIPGAIEEIRNISNLIKSDTYINDEATETIFKNQAGDYKILHLAMHTIIDNNNPMFSKLAFSGNDTLNDGFLNTHEIYNLKLNSKLAILSSCNSGAGKVQKAEGIMSLARGFIYAGCPSVIMTLWRIEDLSSAKLMTIFYKQLEQGHNITESLRQSKISYLNQSDKAKCHPYYWSSYISIGENQRVFSYSPYTYLFVILILIILIGGGIMLRKNK